MKKRLLILLFVFVLAALTACGKKTEPADNGRDDVTQAVTPEAKEPTAAPADEPVDVPTDDPVDDPADEPVDVPMDDPVDAPVDAPVDEPAEDPGEDDYPVVDALGNDPSVYDWNYENFELRIVNAFDYDDHYLVMFDVLGRYAGDPEEIMGASVGDVLTLDGKPVTVTKILSMDSDYNYTVEHESYVEGCRVIVMPEDIHDFYTEEAIAESGMDENPENAEFGFVSFDEGETFDAYCDWAWDDCYVPLNCIVLSGVNFAVTDETLAYPVYYDTEMYGYDYAMPGCEYLKLREEGSYEERSDIKVYPDVCYQIELERDEAGYATGALSVLREIYTP